MTSQTPALSLTDPRLSSDRPSPRHFITIRGAAEHNLKNINVVIPKQKLVVITGLSGSGKSSLAFDTIYAEGQRRHVESLSTYVRHFLEQLKKPTVESIDGLAPAIAIEQKSITKNPRSTVGTITEIYDYLRLLFAKCGTAYCPECEKPITSQSIEQIVTKIEEIPTGCKINILSPIVRGKKGEFQKELTAMAKSGFIRAMIDGQMVNLDQTIKLDKNKKHSIDIFIDRLIMKEGLRQRLMDSVESASQLSRGLVKVEVIDRTEFLFSESSACPNCGVSIPEISPRLFSFNSPYGACSRCNGLGEILTNAENEPVARVLNPDTPVDFASLFSKSVVEEPDTEGPVVSKRCPECEGARLSRGALSVRIGRKSIADVSELSVSALIPFLKKLSFSGNRAEMADRILREMLDRLQFLNEVGVGYLSLSRSSMTLSGGEEQRVRLAAQIGSKLTGVLYVLDEPSIGLHPRDNLRLIEMLRRLRDLGNSVIVVEHDEETIRSADHVIDMGPRAGRLGGEIIAQGTPTEVANTPNSLTGQYLKGSLKISVPETRRPGNKKLLTVQDARHHNLKRITVQFPLNTLICVTGVSGSGKSSLVRDILYRALAQKLYRSPVAPGEHGKITGIQHIDKVIDVDQSPIGRTPRSNPVTYVGVFTLIRDLFAALPESKVRGFGPSRYSFNVSGGRCENCQGGGMLKIEMPFLPDVFVECDVCQGRRYSPEILDITYKGKSIAAILDLTVNEAIMFFESLPKIRKRLEVLRDVGLGYLHLGQSATTLSGGEAQRVKLSKELSRVATGRTLYILDEPTTGLHFEDIRKLLSILNRLVDKGNTVVIIEHNLDVIKSVDYIIDLGPEGGEKGGELVAVGTPEAVARSKASVTGKFLKPLLFS